MLRCVLASLIAAAVALPTRAAEFYEGKTITLIVSSGTIGSYGEIAFSVSRNMPRRIPGQPTIIVKGMPGAGNVLATNYLFNIAPKDGTTIGLINNSIPLHQVLDGRGVQYDASKFNWLGSTGSYNSVTYVWHTAGIKTIEDVMKKEVILGGTGVGSSIVIYPMVMNNVLGTKFKIVTGYKLTTEIDLAMERGEVQARSGSYAALMGERPDWVRDKKIVIIAQVGLKRDTQLPDVPMMTDLAKSDDDRQVLKLISSPIPLGRPFLAPGGVPDDRVTLLRKALAETFRDEMFLAEMAKIQIDISPASGEEVAQIVADTVGAPPEIIAKAKVAMGDLSQAN